MTCRLFFTLLLSVLALPYACKANAPESSTDAAPVPEIQGEAPAVPALDEPVVDQSTPAPESVEAPASSAPSTTTQQPSKSDDFIYDATAVQAATTHTP